MTKYDEESDRAARSAFLATGIAAAGAAALILLPKVRRALADTIDLAEEAARRWSDAAEDVAEEYTARTAGRREDDSEHVPEAPKASTWPDTETPEPETSPESEASTKSGTASTSTRSRKDFVAGRGSTKKIAATGGTTETTSTGHVNPKGQTVIRRVGKRGSLARRSQSEFNVRVGGVVKRRKEGR